MKNMNEVEEGPAAQFLQEFLDWFISAGRKMARCDIY